MKLFKALILFVTATVLLIVFLPIALIAQLTRAIWKWEWQPVKDFFGGFYTGVVFLFYQVAVVIDKSGARILAPVLNAIFITSESKHLFGSQDENGVYYTISTILGYNYLDNTLTGFGYWFKEFLDLFEKDHIIKSV